MLTACVCVILTDLSLTNILNALCNGDAVCLLRGRHYIHTYWTLKKDAVTGYWRILHNEQLHGLYSSRNIVRAIKSRRMRWAGHVARMEEGRGVHKVLVGKPEGKRPLGETKT